MTSRYPASLDYPTDPVHLVVLPRRVDGMNGISRLWGSGHQVAEGAGNVLGGTMPLKCLGVIEAQATEKQNACPSADWTGRIRLFRSANGPWQFSNAA